MRIGIGYDIHRLVENRKLILGGIEIPFPLGLEGHSDADALVHSIIDALLGAAALGDIGTHFPVHDPKWKDANSIEMLKIISRMLADKGFAIVNIDANIIAEKPKMLQYIPNMRKNIASASNIDIERISIKAKTNEGLDSSGKGESIASMAVALIE
ncbi:2-C-methyl-D-erythritol 2,4-cyclodiphosphate synthase [bacterium]|nr:2-C-methyl-D-erythritol 2,4-cyclodiphosphate synthase [bacterium]